jgi:hypothetical protein
MTIKMRPETSARYDGFIGTRTTLGSAGASKFLGAPQRESPHPDTQCSCND